MRLLSVLVMLIGLASLFPASVPAASDPENLSPLASKLEPGLQEWLVAWRTVQPKLRLEQFKKAGTSTVRQPWRTISMDVGQEHPGFPVFIFSADRRMFIDVLGGLTMSKRDGYVEVGFQPDSWVYLIDQERSRIRQILMSGTAGGFHDAVWLSNEGFAVAGYGEARPKENCLGGFTWAPRIWLINLPRDSITGYVGPDSCQGIRGEYILKRIQEKIPNVRF